MHFRSVADLSTTITQNLHRIPTDVDLVVGVPRSGILSAAIIALHRNLSLTDVDGLLAGRILGIGHTRRGGQSFAHPRSARHILVVDDSVNTGRSMANVRRRLEGIGLDARITLLAIYVDPGQEGRIDIALELVQMPRVFEWNVLHHSQTERMCLDIDGVLCRDPTRGENDDGTRYREFILGVSPLVIPSYKVGYLVTNRLEKYREDTEAWLDAVGVQYGELVMLNLPSASARRRLGNYGVHKASVYRDAKADLFVESDSLQAETIARISGKVVLCWETMALVKPGIHAWKNPRSVGKRLWWSSRSHIKALLRRSFGW